MTCRALLPPGDGEVLLRREVSLEPDLGSARAARRVLADVLEQAGRSCWADAGALALSEVVTNAALHAHTAIRVVIEVRDDRLQVEVHDGSLAPPRRRGYGSRATTGRGMALVTALTDRCGVQSLGGDGKVVWFTLGQQVEEPTADQLLDGWDDTAWDDGAWDETAWDDGTRDDGARGGGGERSVTLPDVPTLLWLAAREHHDALLRELVLYLAQHDDVTADLALADAARGLVGRAVVQAVEEAQREGTARRMLPEGHPGPLEDVPASVTLVLSVPADVGRAYTALQDALDVGEQLAAAGLLLVHPALPEIVEVRDWVCEQVVAQLAGVPAAPWPGTSQEQGGLTSRTRRGARAECDATVVREAQTGVVAVDHANRVVAVSRPLADTLGWDVEDLVGRRVVALIPPRLREAHVAGFSRHLTTGRAQLRGVPLVLPVQHAAGHELTCRFLVERAPAPGPRPLYLAWIEPVT